MTGIHIPHIHLRPDSGDRDPVDLHRVVILTATVLLALIAAAAGWFAVTRDSGDDAAPAADPPPAIVDEAPAVEPDIPGATVAPPATTPEATNPPADDGPGTTDTPATEPPPAAEAPAPTTTPPEPVVVHLADEAPAYYRVTGLKETGELNVRAGPGVGNSVIARLAGDARHVRSTGNHATVDGKEWKELYVGEATGWATTTYLASDTAEAPPPPIIIHLPDEDPAFYRVVGLNENSHLNVRTDPGQANTLIGALAPDARYIYSTGNHVTVDGKEWKEIHYDDKTGWVTTTYLGEDTAPWVELEPTAPGPAAVVDFPANGHVNIREYPGARFSLVDRVTHKNDGIFTTGRAAMVGDDYWVHVIHENVEGDFISGWMVGDHVLKAGTS